jgi:hypothetical protein
MKVFSQLNGQRLVQKDGAGLVSAGQPGTAFSQLNAFDFFSRRIQKKRSFGSPPFSQLNTGGNDATIAGQKYAFFEEAFSQLNALSKQLSLCKKTPAEGPSKQEGRCRNFRGLKRRAYLYKKHEPRTTRGSVHLEPGTGEIA